MGLVGGALGYRLLRAVARQPSSHCNGSAYQSRSKLEALVGPTIWDQVAGRVVIDFGCGTGRESIEMAQRGATQVIGIDIRPVALEAAVRAARAAQVSDRCRFTQETNEKADLIISIDTFEHVDDPAAILRLMSTLLRRNGRALIAFGPPWYHPFGGHLFSVFPWAHLIFTERALIRWRSDFKADGATKFREVEGGLNQMTVRRFRRLVAESPFQFESIEAIPIRRARFRWNPLTREFLTAMVRCRLALRAIGPGAPTS